jgi:photosystem II stability/assembly factor-like uncharacterized protein
MDPEKASKRKKIPAQTIVVETADGGATWGSVDAPSAGQVASARFAGVEGLLVMGYDETYQWPSDVYKLAGSGLERVYRDKSPRITDALLFQGPRVFLAGVEPTGKMNSAPIPGKVHFLESTDLQTWAEMKVDYKAQARQVILAGPDADHMWAATDTGFILHLVTP